MNEEVNSQQRQLEREIGCLKDTIWRLTTRVCVVESFLKNKYGYITASPTITISPSPVKVIPIVIPDSDHISETASEPHIIMKVESGGMRTDTNSVARPEVVVDPANTIEIVDDIDTAIPPAANSVADTTDAADNLDGKYQSPILNEVDTQESHTDADTSEGDEIRIYKPDLKTFVTVRVRSSEAASTNQVSTSDLECHICHKKFSDQDNVQRHILLHRVAQYKCEECGREFNHQGNLNTHKLRHERMNKRKIEMEERIKSNQERPQTDVENRKFPCSFCQKRFYTAQQRNIHTRIHTGEKPFQCAVCGMRFNQKASLQDHSLGHVGEKNNCCHLCPASFVRSRNLLKHIRQVHKMVQIKTIVNGERVVEFVKDTEAASVIESRRVDAKRMTKPRVRQPRQANRNQPAKRKTANVAEEKESKIEKIEGNDNLSQDHVQDALENTDWTSSCMKQELR